MKSLEQLLADWQSGALSPEELAHLKDALTKPAARSELLLEWQLDQAIYETLRAEVAAPASESESTTTPSMAAADARQSIFSSRSRPVRTRSRLLPWVVWREVRLSWRLPAAVALSLCLLVAGLAVYFHEAAVGRVGTVPRGAMLAHHGRTSAAESGQAIYPGDVLSLAPEATGPAMVMLGADDTRLELAPGAELRFLNSWRGKYVALRAGELHAAVAPQSRWRPMTLLTPQAAARVVGTRFSLSVTGEVTRLSVLEGAVLLRKTVQDRVTSLGEILVRAGQLAIAARDTKLEATLLTGFLSSDTWMASPDAALTDAPKLSTAPAKVSPDQNLVRVERLRGYLIAPATGEYTFWLGTLRGDSPAELWLSPNEQSSGTQRIAWAAGQGTQAAGPAAAARPQDFRTAMEREWRRSPTQRSAPVSLVQGRRYYIEIWHRGSGIDSLALGWTLPGAPNGTPAPVDIQSLCPYISAGHSPP